MDEQQQQNQTDEQAVASAVVPSASTDDPVANLLAAAPFGLIAVGAQHRLTHANERGREVLGLLPQNVVGHALVDSLADPGESPLIDDAIRGAAQGETIKHSTQIEAAGVLRGVDLQFLSLIHI